MLYFLLYEQLYRYVSPLRVFRYTTFRTAFASLTALFLCVVLGPWLISRLRQFEIGQYIREEGPKSHQKKAGTPTMGGILIIISIVIPTLLWADLRSPYVWMAIAAPSESAPTSPMKISAGCALYQRKPRLAPVIEPQKIVSSLVRGLRASCKYSASVAWPPA